MPRRLSSRRGLRQPELGEVEVQVQEGVGVVVMVLEVLVGGTVSRCQGLVRLYLGGLCRGSTAQVRHVLMPRYLCQWSLQSLGDDGLSNEEIKAHKAIISSKALKIKKEPSQKFIPKHIQP